MRDGEKEGNRRSLNWKYTILVTDAIHLSLISHLSFFVILISNSCYFVGIAATMLLPLLQMGDLYRKLSLAQLICFAYCKTVIIFISFVSHDLNLSAIRFRRFVNDFVVCCCVISIWGWIWYTNKWTNKPNWKISFSWKWFCNWLYQYTEIYLLHCFAKWKEMKTKIKFNLDSSDLRLLINFNRFSFAHIRFSLARLPQNVIRKKISGRFSLTLTQLLY